MPNRTGRVISQLHTYTDFNDTVGCDQTITAHFDSVPAQILCHFDDKQYFSNGNQMYGLTWS